MAILTNIRYSGCSSMILIRLFYIITILQHLVTDVNGQMCPWSLNTEALPAITGGTPYKSGSKFESNLKALLNNLAQRTPQTGFNTSVYGQSPNRISGLLQCRGDTTVDQCYNCSKWVTSNVKEFCGNGPGCRVFLDLCYLRYENYSFVGQLGDNGCYINGTGNATNPSVSVSVVHMLWSKLADEAASVVNRCAFNRTVDSLSRNYIYALAQCTRDISTDDCTTCLSQTINNSLSNYPGSQSLQGLMSSCIVRYEPYPFFNSTALPQAPAEAPVHTPPKNTAVPLARAEAPAHTSQINPSSKYKIPIILGAVGGFLLILFVCLFAAIFGRRYEGHRQVQEDALIIQDQPIVKFKMKTLLAATKNFQDDNKLGEGGFGPVYKGITQDGKEIAVKKLSLTSRQGKKEFLNEVKLVAKIRHRNVVNILGCCAEGSERLLVYEYLPNRSLDKILLDPNKPLDWPKRYNIILGVARGLLYLHQDSHLRIIHRDIKASNILLDEKLNPKIADFGLARLFPDDATHISTGAVAGTYGYMAPEYALHGQLSVKVDVYSFGVVLLELVTGRKNTDYNSSSEMQTLLGWAWASYEQGNIEQTLKHAIRSKL